MIIKTLLIVAILTKLLEGCGAVLTKVPLNTKKETVDEGYLGVWKSSAFDFAYRVEKIDKQNLRITEFSLDDGKISATLTAYPTTLAGRKYIVIKKPTDPTEYIFICYKPGNYKEMFNIIGLKDNDLSSNLGEIASMDKLQEATTEAFNSESKLEIVTLTRVK